MTEGNPRPRAVLPTLLAIFIGAAAAGVAQVPTLERGPELERLEPLIGRWEGTLTRFLPNGGTLELTPELDTVWSVGDAWLESRDTTRLPDGTVIHNRTWITWDGRAKTYRGAWHDNVMPDFVTFAADWIDDRHLELDTGEFQLFGRAHRVVFTYAIVSDDEFTIEMRQSWDGAEPRKVAAGRFRRLRPATARG